jgi:phytoene dehydrogenase-like protein
MASIVVLGAGMNGLTAAMLRAGDGHEVTVLERDPGGPPPDEATAWESWDR